MLEVRTKANLQESRMNMHKHTRLTPRGRALLVSLVIEEGLRGEEALQAATVSLRSAYTWLARFRAEGPAGLVDRSSRPRRCRHAKAAATLEQVLEQRRLRRTYHQIAGA